MSENQTQSETQYVYGTFEDSERCQQALDLLHEEGLSGAIVVNDQDIPLTPLQLRILGPQRAFRIAGFIGAIVGGIAGAVASPSLGMPDVFQVITPAMAAVAGAAVCGYMGLVVHVFLHTSHREASVFEVFNGSIARGSTMVAAPVSSSEARVSAFKAFDSCGAREIVVRLGEFAAVETQESTKLSQITRAA